MFVECFRWGCATEPDTAFWLAAQDTSARYPPHHRRSTGSQLDNPVAYWIMLREFLVWSAATITTRALQRHSRAPKFETKEKTAWMLFVGLLPAALRNLCRNLDIAVIFYCFYLLGFWATGYRISTFGASSNFLLQLFFRRYVLFIYCWESFVQQVLKQTSKFFKFYTS